ncbi:unnamed protein product [Polarella glacialis]|uniref:Uncharacterized protein n=1 Tax=Polarella glacialis TaxID=89957 RepID=A0A813FNL0_POLGL|nr:unnamed protein product [Polarella glacialis]
MPVSEVDQLFTAPSQPLRDEEPVRKNKKKKRKKKKKSEGGEAEASGAALGRAPQQCKARKLLASLENLRPHSSIVSCGRQSWSMLGWTRSKSCGQAASRSPPCWRNCFVLTGRSSAAGA